MKKYKKTDAIGISLMGGGMGSVAYAGMFKAFSEKQIPIHALVASSGGAVVASAFALDKTPEEIKNHFIKFNPISLFNPIKVLIKRKLNYSAWLDYMSKLVPLNSQIQDSKIKLAIHVTNLRTKNSEYITKGSSSEAVIASSALIGSYEINKHKYVDGDYDPETGASLLKSLGATFTILVYIETEGFSRIIPFDITQKNALESDILLHPVNKVHIIKLTKSSLFNKKWIEQNYIDGYNQTLEFLNKYF